TSALLFICARIIIHSIGFDDIRMENSWRTEMSNEQMSLWFGGPSEGESNTTEFRCNLCGKYYKRKRTLRRHMYYDCGTEPKFSCRICGVKFRRRYTLTSHLVGVHGTLG
ncbi:hypothetical protein L9F63_014941, partial [Diploptera punctata]